MSVAEDLTVDTSVPQTPAPVLDAPAPAPVVETPAPVQDKRQSTREALESSLKAVRDRPRDEVGRFAQKQPDRTAVAKPAVPTPAQPAAAVAPGAQPKAIERPADMPKAWGADKAAIWSGLPPEAHAYLTEREAQMEAFHAKHAGLAQWQEAATQNGTTLHEVLERVHAVENAMATDASQGLIQACQMVGLDRASAVQALQGALQKLGVQGSGATPPQPGQPPAGEVRDPRYDELARQFQTVTQTLQQQEMQKADAAVRAFAADPANKFYAEVSEDIVRELKAMRALGQNTDLKLAYERACWGRPDIREKLVAEQIATKVPAAVDAKTQELEKARSASRSVAGSPPQAEGRSSADKPSNVRDMLTQQVRAVAGRV
jgi:hypothetical protein